VPYLFGIRNTPQLKKIYHNRALDDFQKTIFEHFDFNPLRSLGHLSWPFLKLQPSSIPFWNQKHTLVKEIYHNRALDYFQKDDLENFDFLNLYLLWNISWPFLKLQLSATPFWNQKHTPVTENISQQGPRLLSKDNF
jgi:hypothetical protein